MTAGRHLGIGIDEPLRIEIEGRKVKIRGQGRSYLLPDRGSDLCVTVLRRGDTLGLPTARAMRLSPTRARCIGAITTKKQE